MGGNSDHLLSHPTKRLVFGVYGLESIAPLVVNSFVKLAGHRPLVAVNLGFQSGAPGDLPPPLQTVLQVYLILNTGQNRRQHVVTLSRLGVGGTQGSKNVSGEILNIRVDSHTSV
jgi:hypothetical protein